MITLPLPPSLNHIYCRAKWGRTYMTGEGKQWKEAAAWTIRTQTNKVRMDKVSVTARVYFRDLKVRDLDNCEKLISDAITMSGVIRDDNWQILNEWHLKGFLDREDPRLELEITPI